MRVRRTVFAGTTYQARGKILFAISKNTEFFMVKVFIDGKEGTTGLKIYERFAKRNDIEILQIDEDALDENFSSFASMLESMDFAELMADGILQIRLGGAEK